MATTSKGKRTQERIYAAASELIAEQGIEGVTMRAVADRAGLSAGAAYHYVRGKDELVLGLYAQTQDALGAHAAQVAASGGGLSERLIAMMAGGFQLLAPKRTLLGHLATAVLAPGSPLSPFAAPTADIRRQAIAHFGQVIGERKDREQLAELCWMVWLGMILFWLHDRTPEQEATQALIHQVVPMFVRALPLFGSTFFGFAALARRALIDDPPEDAPPPA